MVMKSGQGSCSTNRTLCGSTATTSFTFSCIWAPFERLKLNKTSCAFALAGLLSALALPVSAAQAPAAPATTLAAAADSSSAYFLLHHPRALAKFLNLSASQTTQTVAFYNTFQQTVEPLHQARIPLCAQLITDITATPPQPDVVA